MSAAARYETVLLTKRQHEQLLDILRRIADPANAGAVVGLLKAQPALGGRIPYLDILVERYGPEARVVEVIEAVRALRKAWKARAKALEEKGS